MKPMLQPFRAGGRLLRLTKTPDMKPVWRLSPEGLSTDETATAIRPTILVPTEHLLLLAVDLPVGSHRRRLEMLPFAVEDRIGEAMAATHIVLGPEIAPRRYLVAIVSHVRMRAWIADAEANGLDQAALVPDALTVPAPEGGLWNVAVAGERALVRAGNGAGFALPLAQLRLAWLAAGRPGWTLCRGALPAGLLDGEPVAAPEAQFPAVDTVFDLRTGVYARRAPALPVAWRRLAMVAAGGALAHATIAAADTVALQAILHQREEETRALLSLAAPGRPVEADLVDAAMSLVPQGEDRAPGRFLPLLARVAAISGAGDVRWSGFAYRESNGQLSIDIEAAAPESLAAARNALVGAGLEAAMTALSPEGTLVRARIAVRAAGS